MPFSFQLLIEFFFPGLILFGSFLLMTDIFIENFLQKVIERFAAGSSFLQLFYIFLAGLLCYFLGAIFNGVSNCLIRIWMLKYRKEMISRKLGLDDQQDLDKLKDSEKKLIAKNLPKLKSDNNLNELYTAARTYSVIKSELTCKTINYHWSLVRLSRATLFPLLVLGVVLIIRIFVAGFINYDIVGSFAIVLLFILTFINYRYREKFLVYTVFDTFFITSKKQS